MPVYKVNVKWNKQVFNVELNTDEEPALFKAQLYAITSVSIDRQKVLFKGKQIQDSWEGLAIKDGITLLMMGSQEELPKAPEKRTIFMEDLSDNKLTELLQLPSGLDNLGNTCYINATVQCLKTVPEFCKVLRQTETPNLTTNSLVLRALKNLYDQMENNSTVEPSLLVTAILKAIPRFAENQQNGLFQQQDAGEMWTELLRLLQSQLKPIENEIQDDSSPKYDSFIDQYFGIISEATMKCTENEDEESTTSIEKFLHLSCFISQDVKYLINGIKAKLDEKITKRSTKLDRDAIYSKTTKLIRLPSYLNVQMVRYVYKGRESINAKILKDIKFPVMLDVFDLCSPALQDKLLPMRAKFKEQDDRLSESKVSTSGGDQQKDDDKKVDKYVYPTYFKDDLGSNNSGFYELQAVLTHKGRSSSVGHYVAWIKRNNKEWFKCDDDLISPVSEEEILKLSGGGDWHTAYILLYKSRELSVEKKPDGSPLY